MKKLIVLMTLLIATNLVAVERTDSTESKRIEMDRKNLSTNEVERSIDSSIIEAVYYSDLKQVQVSLFNIGEAEIYIVNSQNQVINSVTVDTNLYNVTDLNVYGASGTYYLIVISERCYAEGEFTL